MLNTENKKQKQKEKIRKLKELYPDPCEWNPERNQAAYRHEIHAAAEVIIGSNGEWRLCYNCAKLSPFKKYRRRKEIIK